MEWVEIAWNFIVNLPSNVLTVLGLIVSLLGWMIGKLERKKEQPTPSGRVDVKDPLIPPFLETEDTPIHKRLTALPAKPVDQLFGRVQVQEDLRKAGSSVYPCVVTGMGGLGKTALCRWYYWEKEKDAPYIAWIDYQQGLLTDLPSQLSGLGVGLHKKLSDVEQFQRYLKRLETLPQDTVFIVDNVSDPKDPYLEPLTRLPFPVIFSARGPLPGIPHNLSAEFLTDEAAKALFCTFYQACTETDIPILNKIITRLGGHTLTIELLAKTAQDSGKRLKEVLEEMERNGLQIETSLDAKVTSPWSGVAEDWLFNHLQKVFDMAKLTNEEKELLMKMSLLATVQEEESVVKEWVGADRIDTWNRLKRTGWLLEDPKKFMVWMHPVLQEVARKLLPPQWDKCLGMVDGLSSSMCENQESSYQKNATDVGKYNECRTRYISHGVSVLNIFHDQRTEEISDLASWVAEHYWYVGNYQEAKEWQKKAIQIWEEVLPSNHPYLARSYHNFASILQALGECQEAKEWQRKAIQIWEEVLPGNHPDLATSYQQLADIYRAQGLDDESQKYRSMAEEIRCILR